MNAIVICPSREELNSRVADAILREAEAAIIEHGRFCLALSGGETPRALYQQLAACHGTHDAWQHTHFFFGDERTVSPTHKDSNFAMAHDALLSKINLKPSHIHRIEAEDSDYAAAAQRYEEKIIANVPALEGKPCLDLVLLGIGTDGHIASLFPDTSILKEQQRLVSAVKVPKLNTWRISMTYPLLNHARRIFIIAAGEDKADVVANVLDEKSIAHYPVQDIAPLSGATWFLDNLAAAGLRDR